MEKRENQGETQITIGKQGESGKNIKKTRGNRGKRRKTQENYGLPFVSKF